MTITQVFQRALAIEQQIRLESQFPTGRVPYWERSTYLQIVGRPATQGAPRGPLTTTVFSKTPSEKQRRSPYYFEPSHAMRTVGWMDGYSYAPSIPKFDPWVRDQLRELAPEYSDYLETTFQRDPSTPERIMDMIKRFDQQYPRLPNDPRFNQAIDIVKRLFKPLNNNCEIIDLSKDGFKRILSQLEMTASPGLPLSREYRTQADCLDLIWDQSKRLNHFAKFLPPKDVRAPPCQIASRPGLIEVAELHDKTKARGVWAYPAAIKVMEMRYTIPLYEQFSRLWGKIPYPTGKNMLKGLPMIIDHLIKDDRKGLVTDFSKLDTNVTPAFIHICFDIIQGWYSQGTHNSQFRRDMNVLQFLKYYFIHTPILLPNGQLVRKGGGVPSGSGFTQLVDTLVSLITIVFALLKQGLTEEDIKTFIFAVGDDVAVGLNKSIDLDILAKDCLLCNQIIHPEKVMYSSKPRELKFLGYSKDGWRVERSFTDLMKQAYFPERWVGSIRRSSQRLLGQMIASGMCNSDFVGLTRRMFNAANLENPRIEDQELWVPFRRFAKQVLQLEETILFPDLFNVFTLM